MYKVIIVDDEPLVRKRLRTIIDWKKEGFIVGDEAEDGEEGIKLAALLKPDLVITDIRMPIVNGLELIQEIRRELPSTRFIILSGYSDFEYAHEAIKLGVKDYLLKPVDENELITILRQIKNEIEINSEINRRMYEANNALKERLAQDILNSIDLPGIPIRSAKLGIDINNKYFGVLAIELDNMEDETDEDEINLTKTLVGNAVLEIANNSGMGFLVEKNPGLSILLLILNKPQTEEPDGKYFRKIAENIKQNIDKCVRQNVTIGISSLTQDNTCVRGCCKEAFAALDGKFILGRNRIIQLEDVVNSNIGEGSWDILFGWNSVELRNAIENSNISAINTEIENIFNMIKEKKIAQPLIEGIIIESIISAGRLVKKMEGDVYQIIGEDFDIYTELKRKNTLSELKDWIYRLCIKTTEYIVLLRSNRPRKVSKEVMEFIERHYAEDITLKSIAKVVYMNPVYLGQVFKNDAGISFNDYLTEVRIRNSVGLLTDSETTVYEISEIVGYKAPGNYYKAFKKIYGCSPIDYRSRTRKG